MVSFKANKELVPCILSEEVLRVVGQDKVIRVGHSKQHRNVALGHMVYRRKLHHIEVGSLLDGPLNQFQSLVDQKLRQVACIYFCELIGK